MTDRVLIPEYALKNAKGETYHVIPAEECEVVEVTRWDGRKELAYSRNHGAWLPPVERQETWRKIEC